LASKEEDRLILLLQYASHISTEDKLHIHGVLIDVMSDLCVSEYSWRLYVQVKPRQRSPPVQLQVAIITHLTEISKRFVWRNTILANISSDLVQVRHRFSLGGRMNETGNIRDLLMRELEEHDNIDSWTLRMSLIELP